MKLDRNITTPRRGKYALIKLRQSIITPALVESALAVAGSVSVRSDAIDFGNTAESDFFVIRLKDKYAESALRAYAAAASFDDPEYANEIRDLADIAKNHPNKKRPD